MLPSGLSSGMSTPRVCWRVNPAVFRLDTWNLMVSRAGLEPATTALKVQIGHLNLHHYALFSVTYSLSKGHREPQKDKKVAKSDARSNWLRSPVFVDEAALFGARQMLNFASQRWGVRSALRDDANFETSRRDSRFDLPHFDSIGCRKGCNRR